MAITASSSSLATAANKIVSINSKSQGSTLRVINQYKEFSRFLEFKTLEIQRIELPNPKDIKNLTKINVANTFGSAGGLLGGLLGGGLDVAGLIRGVFNGKNNKIGKSPKYGNPNIKPKPTLKGNRLRLGGVRALGVTNALFAGLDFATGLAQGESIGKSAAGTAGSLAGSILGGAIGQTLIPIPGLGFVVGSAVGGFLGGWTADRAYDAASGAFGSLRQKQEQELEKGKREKPNVVENMNIEKQNRVLNMFSSSVSSFEGLVRGILEGKISLGNQAPMDDIQQAEVTRPTPGPGQVMTAEGGELPSKYVGSLYGDNRGHKGVDYIGPKSSPISVIMPGRVTLARKEKGYGNVVFIEHPNGMESIYGHLKEIKVAVGQEITPGTVIGLQGYTGRVRPAGPDGEHLHFELRPKGGGLGSGIYIEPGEADKYFRFGGNVRVASRPAMDSNLTGAATPMTDLVPGSTVSTAYGRQSSMAASNLPTTKSDNIKGYIIVPGHITGGGAEGEIRAVEKVAMNIVNKLKAQFPGIPIQLWNIRNYPQTDAGFRKQMSDLKKLEDQGWQVLELHFDAPGGTGRGLIAPYNRSTINPLESELSKLGLYPADWRGLLGPRKGISLFELGNMTDKLREAMDRGDQRAVDYFSRDVISAFQNLTYSGRMPGYAAQRPSQAMPIASRSANLNINYGLPYNSPSQVIIIDRPTVTMVPMGSSGGTQVIPVPTGGGGDSVSVVISNPSNATDLLNKIQEYRLV